MSAEQTQANGGVAEVTLIDEILDHTSAIDEQERGRNKSYIEQFVKKVVDPGQVISKDVAANIKFWIKRNRQEAVGPTQRSDARRQLPETRRRPGAGCTTWCSNSETGESLKIRVLNVKKEELQKDLEKAVEFDQSTLFKKVYENEYGQLGGQPYGMLIGDYSFSRHPDDINLLKLLSNVAAAAHAPFIAGADPKLFNMD